MYAVHFYAATHKDDLRNKVINAIKAGTPVLYRNSVYVTLQVTAVSIMTLPVSGKNLSIITIFLLQAGAFAIRERLPHL